MSSSLIGKFYNKLKQYVIYPNGWFLYLKYTHIQILYSEFHVVFEDHIVSCAFLYIYWVREIPSLVLLKIVTPDLLSST